MHATHRAGPPRAARTLGWVCLAWVLASPLARGQTIDFNSNTLIRLHPDWRAGAARTGVGAVEWLGLSARGLTLPFASDISVQVSGWGSADMLARSPDRILAGDVDLAYVQGSLFKRHLSLTLGRQLVTGGAAR